MSSSYFSKKLDPRLTPSRPDLAASWMKDHVKSERYIDPVRRVISSPVASLYKNPDHPQSIETQLLFGEEIDVLEQKNDWSWVQSVLDGYVGYIHTQHLSEQDHASSNTPTHRISNVGTFVFPEADIKTTPSHALSYGSRVIVTGEKNDLAQLACGGYVPAQHLAPLDFHSEEPVAEAFRFLGIPYLWGGRSHIGLDCSALVQLVLHACHYAAPRDADLQEIHVGKPIDREQVQGGDLVFFRGHVALMVDDSTIIHANDRSMAVSIDDLDEYCRWRAKTGKTPVKMFKRFL